MSKRFFTADFHLGMGLLLNKNIMKQEVRPFKTIGEMNTALLDSCIKSTTSDDTIIHIGDLCCYGKDRNTQGLDESPNELLSKIPATFINIHGNHDINNKVKSLCKSMRIQLGKRFPDVSLSHYPSYSSHAIGHFCKGDIHLCGHVHSAWKHCLDVSNQVLNINVGVDCWNYKIISEDDLIQYINYVLSLPTNKLNKIEIQTNE